MNEIRRRSCPQYKLKTTLFLTAKKFALGSSLISCNKKNLYVNITTVGIEDAATIQYKFGAFSYLALELEIKDQITYIFFFFNLRPSHFLSFAVD